MWWKRKRTLPEHCGDLARGVIALDEKVSTAALRGVVGTIGAASPAELTEGARLLVPAIRQVSIGNGGHLAQIAAGLVESGADPFVMLDALVERVTDGLERAARFPALAEKDGGEFLPPDGPAAAEALMQRVGRAAEQAGMDAREAGGLAEAFFTVDDWIPALLLPLQQKRVRQDFPGRDRLVAAAGAMSDWAESAPWLRGLLLVLDDEPFLVVHRESGRVFELTISGVGDNFQLHTLLAATLVGDPARGLIAGTRPDPVWIAAATDGEDLQPAGGVRGQFELTSVGGERVWHEGRPLDIPVLDGRRVVVLSDPSYARSWNTARVYPLMHPEITLDRILPEDEAAGWLERVGGPAST